MCHRIYLSFLETFPFYLFFYNLLSFRKILFALAKYWYRNWYLVSTIFKAYDILYLRWNKSCLALIKIDTEKKANEFYKNGSLNTERRSFYLNWNTKPSKLMRSDISWCSIYRLHEDNPRFCDHALINK